MDAYKPARIWARRARFLLLILAVIYSFHLAFTIWYLLVPVLPQIPFFASEVTTGEQLHVFFVLFVVLFVYLPLTVFLYGIVFLVGVVALLMWKRHAIANLEAFHRHTAQVMHYSDGVRSSRFSFAWFWRPQQGLLNFWRRSIFDVEIDQGQAMHTWEPPKLVGFLWPMWVLALPALLGNLYMWLDWPLSFFGVFNLPSGSLGFVSLIDKQLNDIALTVALGILAASNLVLVLACFATAKFVKSVSANQEAAIARRRADG